jgi:hypothetical protein
MIRRTVAILIALGALLIGASAAWVAISVPRDVRAEALLKDARAKLQTGDREGARKSFQEIVKSYPRTDAAAAASYALFRLGEQEAAELRARLDALDRTRSAQETMTAEERRAQAAERPQREADRQKIAQMEMKIIELETRLAALQKAASIKAAPAKRTTKRK